MRLARGRWALTTFAATASIASVGAFAACGGASSQGVGVTKPEPACSAIAGTAGSVEPPRAPPTPTTSTLVAEVGIELAGVRARLEKEVPRRLGQGSDEPIGAPGRVTYAVDRGAFTIALRGDDVVIRMPFSATASVCKPTGPFGCVTYGRCAPAGVVEAKVSGRLGEDWSIAPAKAEVTITKRCVMTALDVDVTPELEKRARTEVKKAEQRINAALPKTRPLAEDAWRTFQQPVPLGAACLVMEPRTVTQGPPRLVDDVLSMRVSIEATPSLVLPCPAPSDATPPRPLPKLAQAKELPESFALHLSVDAGRAHVDAQLSASLEGTTAGAVRVGSVRARTSSEGLVVDAELGGATCATASFVVEPAWDPKRRLVIARAMRPLAGEHARLAAAISPAALDALAAAIRGRLAIGLPFDDEAIEQNLTDAAKLAAGQPVTLSLHVRERGAEGLFVVPSGLEGRFHAEGTLRAVGRDVEPPKKPKP